MNETSGRPFIISRVLDAPRGRVWQVLTQAEHVREWWSPTGFTMIAISIDLRPGGVFHCGMRSGEGYKMWGKFTYQEIVPPERIVFINSFSNEAGGVTKHPIVPTWPMETLITITLGEEPGGKTNFSVHWTPHNATEIERKTFDTAHVGMRATWAGTLDRLAALLAKAS